MKRLSSFHLILSLLTVVSVAYVDGMKLEVTEGAIKGRIYEATTRRGIPGLIVRLIPTVAMKKPEKITDTDDNGEFRFADLEKGRYLLEVYQGLTLLYRDTIDTKQTTNKEIELKRKDR